ncbi:MAG TPA: UdgX family uracil-DNA binding protein [Polyangia bacterium]
MAFAPAWEAWRSAVRPLLAQRVPASEVVWRPDNAPQEPLPGLGSAPPAAPLRSTRAGAVSIPRAFAELAEKAACHRDPDRWALLYRIAFRLTGGERSLLDDEVDPDVRRLRDMARAVDHDVHRMHAFVRFRRIDQGDQAHDERGETGEHPGHYVAFHRPDHFIVARAAPFFVERFNPMRWSILTPDASAHWDGSTLSFGPGVPRATVDGDALEELWRTYYTAAFNPARANLAVVVREMPRRHWKTLPEASLVEPLLQEARARTAGMMVAAPSAKPYLPGDDADLAALAQAARTCQGCPLFAPATQTVFGEGPSDATIMLVGEQPGDEEDRRGHPFVGPAGQVLDAALAAVGLDRRQIYVTNAVKHFKFTPRGKWRIHQKPSGNEVRACEPWLGAELRRVQPRVLVALGATAAQILFGGQVRLQRDRGQPIASPHAPRCLVTYHPSAVLRAGGPEAGALIEAALRTDLALAAQWQRDAQAG